MTKPSQLTAANKPMLQKANSWAKTPTSCLLQIAALGAKTISKYRGNHERIRPF
jgi:hypothetical protein